MGFKVGLGVGDGVGDSVVSRWRFCFSVRVRSVDVVAADSDVCFSAECRLVVLICPCSCSCSSVLLLRSSALLPRIDDDALVTTEDNATMIRIRYMYKSLEVIISLCLFVVYDSNLNPLASWMFSFMTARRIKMLNNTIQK